MSKLRVRTAAIVGFVVLGFGCSDDPTEPPRLAPPPIPLTGYATTEGVTLTWQDPVGSTSYRHELRWSTSPIDDSNWGTAVLLEVEPTQDAEFRVSSTRIPTWDDAELRHFAQRFIDVAEADELPGAVSENISVRPAGRSSALSTQEARPYWSPQRDSHAYREVVGGTSTLFVTSNSRSWQTELGPADSNPGWSPDGSRLAVARSGEIWTVAAEGGDPKLAWTGVGTPTQISWSPTSRHLAFTVSSGQRQGVWVVDLETQESRLLSDSFRDAAGPRWSPDGSQVVFLEVDFLALRSAIWVAGVEGESNRTVLELDGIVAAPRWSPDGTRLVYTDSSSEAGIVFIIDLAGGIRSRTRIEEPVRGAAWSPDSELIAIRTGLSRHGNLYLVSALGGLPGKVTGEGEPAGTDPAFSVDGAELLFWTGEEIRTVRVR